MTNSVLFIGKSNDFYCDRAVEFIKAHFPQHTVVLGTKNEPLPEAAKDWQGDVIISYLSPWIIPSELLERSEKQNLNFHPGPPEYPGIGCTNFAIYDEAKTFGVTCHHMNPQVDTGKLVSVKRFPLYKTDSVYTLTQRCYAFILQQFYEVMSHFIDSSPIPELREEWKRKPFKRQELNELCKITPDMSDSEINRRVRAVTFPNAPGAYIELDGMQFTYQPQK